MIYLWKEISRQNPGIYAETIWDSNSAIPSYDRMPVQQTMHQNGDLEKNMSALVNILNGFKV